MPEPTAETMKRDLVALDRAQNFDDVYITSTRGTQGKVSGPA